MKTHSSKPNRSFKVIREDSTPDARWAFWVDCMREFARIFFSLDRTSKHTMHKRDCRHCAASWFLNKRRADNIWESSGRHAGTWETTLDDICTAQAHDLELAIAPMGKTVRSSPKDFPGIGAALSTERWKNRRSTQIDAAVGERRKRLFFHLLGSRPKQEEMKTHVTMLGARRGLDAEVVDVRETQREFQADMPPLEPLDMNMVTRAKTIFFRTAKELANGNKRRAAPRWSAPAELFLMCASLSFLSVGPRRLEGIGVEEISNPVKKYTCARRNLSPFWYTHKGHSTHFVAHTIQTAP